MATFIERVQALSAELYNEIHDLTFTMASGTIYIDAAYRPPALLQINRLIRITLADPYYGNTSIFYIEREVVSKWLQSTDPAAVEDLKEVRISNKRFRISEDLTPIQLYQMLSEETSTLGRFGHDFLRVAQILRFEVVCGDRERTKWVSLSDLTWGGPLRGGLLPRSAREWVEIYGSE